MPRLKSHSDACAYLRGREWSHTDDLGCVRLWRLPALTGKHWVSTEHALCLALQAEVEALKDENRKLREKYAELRKKKRT